MIYRSIKIQSATELFIQPSFVPPNCRFEVDDITNEWTYPEDTFDFIHARSMIGCLPDWTEFYRKAFKYVYC